MLAEFAEQKIQDNQYLIRQQILPTAVESQENLFIRPIRKTLIYDKFGKIAQLSSIAPSVSETPLAKRATIVVSPPQVSERDQQLASLQAQIKSERERANRAEARTANLEGTVELAKDKLRSAEARIIELERSLLEATQQTATAKEASRILEALNAALRRDAKTQEGVMAQLASLIVKIKENNAGLKSQVAQLRAKVGSIPTPSSLDRSGHYAILGLDPRTAFNGLTEEQIQILLKSIYNGRSKIHHPDTGGSDEAMRRVNSAIDALKDPRKRR